MPCSTTRSSTLSLYLYVRVAGCMTRQSMVGGCNNVNRFGRGEPPVIHGRNDNRHFAILSANGNGFALNRVQHGG